MTLSTEWCLTESFLLPEFCTPVHSPVTGWAVRFMSVSCTRCLGWEYKEFWPVLSQIIHLPVISVVKFHIKRKQTYAVPSTYTRKRSAAHAQIRISTGARRNWFSFMLGFHNCQGTKITHTWSLSLKWMCASKQICTLLSPLSLQLVCHCLFKINTYTLLQIHRRTHNIYHNANQKRL